MIKFHKAFVTLVLCLAVPFKVSTYRVLFFRECKVRVYLQGGHHVDLYCEKWAATPGEGGFKKYSFTNLRHTAAFDITQIQAVVER